MRLGSGFANGGHHHPHARSVLRLVGDGAQYGLLGLAGDDAAPLPLGGRDDHEIGHGGGHNRDGGILVLQDVVETEIDYADGARDHRRMVLRGVRRCGDGRSRFHHRMVLTAHLWQGPALVFTHQVKEPSIGRGSNGDGF